MMKENNVLIVDDEESIRKLVHTKLSDEGYICEEAADGEQALKRLRKGVFGLMLLDNKMPGRSGIELLPELSSAYPTMAIVMATVTDDIGTAINCMKQGAYDYITKPFDLERVAISVNRALEKRRLTIENAEYRNRLEDRVAEQTRKIRALSFSAITALVNALEAKDVYTSGHSLRVADIAVRIARTMGLQQEMIDNIQLAGLVHDVGKIGIRESILNKPSNLDEDELQQARRHPEIGERILVPIADDAEFLRLVRNHHERYDGNGYPDGLKGAQIPIGARIMAISDAYEAMTSERPYRPALTDKEARAELECRKGTQFDPDIVDVFLRSGIQQGNC